MMMTLAAALCLALAAHPAADDAPEGDLGKLQGKWAALVGPQKDIPLLVTFKGKAVTLSVELPDGTDIELKGEVKLDEEATPHKTLDWVKFTGPQGNPVADNPAIYKFEGDQLTICSGGPNNERPGEFKAAEGVQYPSLVVLKRQAE